MEDAGTSRLSFSVENCATRNGQGIGHNQQTCACCQGKGRILVAHHGRSACVVAVPANQNQEIAGVSSTA